MRIPNSFKYLFVPLLCFWSLLCCRCLPCLAASGSDDAVYTNEQTGYSVFIDDSADLLSKQEEAALCTDMQPITAFGNALFVSVSENPYSAAVYAENYYYSQCPGESGTLFLIDMDNRVIQIYSDGSVYRVVTADYAYTITDNVYRYAGDGSYYQCASKAYGQIYALLQGQKIAQPMKYISNLFLALLLALLVNYFLVRLLSRARKPSRRKLLNHVPIRWNGRNLRKKLISQKKVYISSGSGGGGHSSGGGGHSSGGGGHSSGGGHSGGGGGHRF